METNSDDRGNDCGQLAPRPAELLAGKEATPCGYDRIGCPLIYCRIYVTDQRLSRSDRRISGEHLVGFESSRAARRRLAAIAATNDRVQEALSPSVFPGLFGPDNAGSLADAVGARRAEPALSAGAPNALARQLESLARDIVATPGAGGALLAAYAAQARALLLVVEAARRGGQAPLPQAVLAAAQEALQTPSQLAGLV